MGRFVMGASRARFSTAPNAKYGPADIAKCMVEASVQNRNVASAASAKRDTMKKCGLAPDRPCGEWLRLSLRGISPDEAVAEFDRFTAGMIAEMKGRGLLDGKLDMGIDFHNIATRSRARSSYGAVTRRARPRRSTRRTPPCSASWAARGWS